MAGEEPVRDLVDAVAALAAEVVEASQDAVDDGVQGRSEMTPGDAREVVPLALMGVELGL